MGCVTVDSTVFCSSACSQLSLVVPTEFSELTVIFQDVKDTTHLGKDKHTRSFCLHRFEQFVENDHFSGVIDEMLVGGEGRSGFLIVS